MATMMVVKNPTPTLRDRSQELDVSTIASERVQELINHMIETMQVENGVGIAAPQVGVNERIIIVETPNGNEAYINPKIVEASDTQVESEEGCLSVPGVYGIVMRHKKVVVEAYNRAGKPVRMPVGGFPAIIFQHEIDHLDGCLFIDRVVRYTKGENLLVH